MTSFYLKTCNLAACAWLVRPLGLPLYVSVYQALSPVPSATCALCWTLVVLS